MLRKIFKNKSLNEVIKDSNIDSFEFKKSYVSGFSILAIENTNTMTSFTYYNDEKGRDADFKTLKNEQGRFN